MIIELKAGNTNTYLIPIKGGYILFDTPWAGTFTEFCKAIGQVNVSASDIKYVFVSHFHPDHMGIAQNIADLGATIVVLDVQKDYIHWADKVFEKDKRTGFIPIDDTKVKLVEVSKSRSFLKMIGAEGEVIHTPGHTDDSISLKLDSGELFVGDLNPLYELELHKGTAIHDSWDKLLSLHPMIVYYGHARAYEIYTE